MNPDNIIVAGIIAPVIGKFFKSKKGSEHVKVDVRLTYTKRDLFFELSFILLALLTWGFALWIFLKAGFSYRQLFSCIVFNWVACHYCCSTYSPARSAYPRERRTWQCI